MAEVDALVGEVLLRWFKLTCVMPGTDAFWHLKGCPTVRVTGCEHHVECECWSEHTREDWWVVTAHLTCDCGTTYRWTYPHAGSLGLPAVLETLREADRRADPCRHDEGEG